MSTISLIERYPQNKRSKISIRPYFEPNKENQGLEKYGMVLFDNAFHVESIACIHRHGIIRFITGLDEFAPEVINLEGDAKAARIKEIRKVVAMLEKQLKNNVIPDKDLSGEEFWNKVQLLKPDNIEFWDRIQIRVSNEPLYLDVSDPYDLIRLYAIEAGGFSLVAPSLDAARKMSKPPKFYLDKMEETASTRTEVKKLRNKALAELEKMYNKNQSKLFYVAKVIDINSAQYKKSTPNDILYDNMDRYINGESIDRDKRKAAEKFLEIAELDMEQLKIRAIIKDANQYKIFATKPDGFIYHIEKNVMLGKNMMDIIEFMKNPLNEEVLIDTTKSLESYWNA